MNNYLIFIRNLILLFISAKLCSGIRMKHGEECYTDWIFGTEVIECHDPMRCGSHCYGCAELGQNSEWTGCCSPYDLYNNGQVCMGQKTGKEKNVALFDRGDCKALVEKCTVTDSNGYRTDDCCHPMKCIDDHSLGYKTCQGKSGHYDQCYTTECVEGYACDYWKKCLPCKTDTCEREAYDVCCKGECIAFDFEHEEVCSECSLTGETCIDNHCCYDTDTCNDKSVCVKKSDGRVYVNQGQVCRKEGSDHEIPCSLSEGQKEAAMIAIIPYCNGIGVCFYRTA